MKFQDYQYKRPNLEEVKTVFDKSIEAFNNAKTLEEQITIIEEINQIRSSYTTMGVICSIRSSIDTRDEFYESEQNFFDENDPIYASYVDQFKRTIVASRFKMGLVEKYGEHWFNLIESDLKTFSPEIIEDLQTENRLVSEHRKLTASAKIEYDGKINNLSQMAPYATSKDRSVRKTAEALIMKFFEENVSEFDRIYDELVKTRNKMATKLGFKNYVEFGYLRLNRTDYNSEMVANYRKQVLTDLVPVVSKIYENQRIRLGLDELKSYDVGVAYLSGNPKPVGEEAYLVATARDMYHEMSAETKEFIDFMIDHNLLDLTAKPGKSGGGYCTFIPDYKSPFIFSNFNGTSGDVDVLTHEAGHAFQVFSVRDQTVMEYTWPTLEACEIHSMSMEFFAWPWMDKFFGDDVTRYKYQHLAGSITFIPYGVLVDHYQHEVYENPNMTPAERKQVWRKLEKMYRPHLVYENEFLEKGNYWLRQSHIFSTAFYYIDYTLAQVCAHQYFISDQADHKKAWESYYKLCRQGGSKSFLELLKVAGLDNPFVDGTVKRIAVELEKFLDSFDKSKLI